MVTPHRTPFVIMLTLPASALGIALAVQISALSWLLSTRYGLAIDQIGVVWAAGPIAGILGQLLIGNLSDRIWWLGGRRRPFVIISAAASAAALLALPQLGSIAHALGLASVIGVAILVALTLDLAINIGLNPARAVIADMTSEGTERSSAFVWMQTLSGGFSVGAYGVGAWFGNLALVTIAPLIIVALGIVPMLIMREPRIISKAGDTPTLTTGAIIGMTAPLAPLAALVAVQLGGSALGLRLPVGPLLALAATAMIAAAVPVLYAPAGDQSTIMRKLVTAHGLSWLGAYCLFIFLAPFAQQRMPGLSAEALGRVAAVGFLAFNAVGALAPIALLAPLTRRFRRAHVHAGALLLMAECFGAIGLTARTPMQLWLLLGLAGIGWGAMVSLPFAMLCDRVDARRLGLILGVFNLSIVVPQLVASFGIGALAATLIDRGAVFVIAGASIAASAIAWLFIPPLPLTLAEGSPT